MTLLVLFHTMDPRGSKLGGIETHVRTVLARHDGPVVLVGVDEHGDLPLGHVQKVDCGGRDIRFLPVARVEPDAINRAAVQLMRSVTLRFLLGALRHLPAVRRVMGREVASCEIERFEFAILPFLLRRPSVLMVHNEHRRDAATDGLVTRYWWLHRLGERVALELATRIFAVNPAIAARIGRLSPRFERKTAVLSVSVDTDRFSPAPFPGGDTFRVCFAGRLDAFKDPALMLASLVAASRRLELLPVGRFRRLRFDYVGASDIAAIPGYAEAAAFVVQHGPKSAHGVASLMRGSHAGIITSFFEGMPCYLLEMLASGRPVAAVDLPQFRSLLGTAGGGGRIVARAATTDLSADKVAEALLALAAGIDEGVFAPEALAAIVRPFAIGTQMGRLFETHRALAQGRASTSRA